MPDSPVPVDVEHDGGFDFAAFVARCNELGCLTDEQRAELAGISIRTYYRWQAGASPTLDRLGKVAKRLGVPSARLMGGAQ